MFRRLCLCHATYVIHFFLINIKIVFISRVKGSIYIKVGRIPRVTLKIEHVLPQRFPHLFVVQSTCEKINDLALFKITFTLT